jgi:membrane protein implicated in regulation of membrane protease activity
MILTDSHDKPLSNLIQGIFLIIFCSSALFVAWILTRADVHWFFLVCMIVSFIIPALAAFWLGVKRLHAFAKNNKSSNQSRGRNT